MTRDSKGRFCKPNRYDYCSCKMEENNENEYDRKYFPYGIYVYSLGGKNKVRVNGTNEAFEYDGKTGKKAAIEYANAICKVIDNA